ncbi:aluminum resistance protein [hydrocarbon metagenome]|uniref:Aluminum resistance protein n=1 Tax=hydrocarbon metagenome TaxID=938273 RepID=A0A0W8E851_9ZZZZ
MQALQIIRTAENKLTDKFSQLEETAYINQLKVLEAFQKYRVREYHFHPSTGYGYDDAGRAVLEDIYAQVFSAEASIVRSQIVSGTHAIAACLFGLLKPDDELLSLSGRPYDTLAGIITDLPGSLISKKIRYKEIDLDSEGKPDLNKIIESVSSRTSMVLIQRSRGYSERPALTVEEIKTLSKTVKEINSRVIVFVDNCYGEFVQEKEPLEAGADLIAGSLIKNPGGGLAPAGGYICGRRDLVEQIAWYLTAPGLGKELGAVLINKRWFYQGLFMAPHTVLQALKGATLLAYLLEQYGYNVSPLWNEKRGDIVQAVKFTGAEEVIRFCQIVQDSSPVDSDVKLEYGELPGYTDKIVMAAGTFVQGSSIELSCDAPMRRPYCAYLQGGLTYEHVRYVTAQILKLIGDKQI